LPVIIEPAAPIDTTVAITMPAAINGLESSNVIPPRKIALDKKIGTP